MGWDKERFIDKDCILNDLICSICTEVILDPVQTPCEHCFCKECITTWLDEKQKFCPVDRKTLTADDLTRPYQEYIGSNLIRRALEMI